MFVCHPEERGFFLHRKIISVLAILFSLLLSEIFLPYPASGATSYTVTYTYDETTGSTNGIGRLTSVSEPSGTTTKFSYDLLGRTIETDKTVDNQTYIFKNSYDPMGRVKSITYPDGDIVYRDYNGPVLKQIYIDPAHPYALYTGFNVLGMPGSLNYGDGTSTLYTYNNSANSNTQCIKDNFRLCSLITVSPAGSLQNLLYTYDSVGNVLSINDVINGAQTFVYDDLNRLTQAAGPYGSISYSYDEIGNMTCNSQISPCSAIIPNYYYPPSGSASVQPHAVTTAGINSYQYDLNGNLVVGGGRSITYDSENRPITVTSGETSTTFVYDGTGNRIKKSATGITTTYITDLYECTSAICLKYLFGISGRLAIKEVGTGNTYYYHSDHLGSSSVMTQYGLKVQSVAYFPYGQTRVNTGSIDIRHKFTGQEMDAETGLYYYGSRYYDPVLGRFISADSVVQSRSNPQTLNRYSYVLNNPVKYLDPDGRAVYIAGHVAFDPAGYLCRPTCFHLS